MPQWPFLLCWGQRLRLHSAPVPSIASWHGSLPHQNHACVLLENPREHRPMDGTSFGDRQGIGSLGHRGAPASPEGCRSSLGSRGDQISPNFRRIWVRKAPPGLADGLRVARSAQLRVPCLCAGVLLLGRAFAGS